MSNPSEYKDQIDLFDIIEIIFKKIKFISLITLISLILSLLYINFFPVKKNARIAINPIEITELQKFKQINHTLIELEISEKDFIDKDTLFLLFLNKLFEFEILSKNYKEFIKNHKTNLTDIEIEQTALNFINTFSYSNIPNQNQGKLIKFKSNDISMATSVLSDVFMEIDNEIYLELIESLENYKNFLSYKINTKMEKLNSQLKLRKEKFIIQNNREIHLLNEQIEIAKTLDIKDDTKITSFMVINEAEGETAEQKNKILTNNPTLPKNYLRGYLSLEIQLTNLKNRNLDNISLYDNLYGELLVEKLDVMNDDSIVKIDKSIEKLKSINNFSASNYNSKLIKHQNNSYVLVAFITICSMIIAIIYTILINLYKIRIK